MAGEIMSKNLIRIASSHALPIKQDDGKVARSPPEKPVISVLLHRKRALKLLKVKDCL
jgi:hypothetical protein